MNTLQVLIPTPQKVTLSGGKADLGIVKSFYIDSSFSALSDVITGMFRDFNIKSIPADSPNDGTFKLLYLPMPPESFRLAVNETSFTVKAGDAAGAAYALSACRQIFFAALIRGNKYASFDCGTVEDAPRFAMRSLHLDSARHFQSVDVIRQYLKAMAEFRLNTFHWHLVDGQGWRLPLAATAGLEKTFTVSEGFYTLEEIAEVRKLANSLNIKIIPEIDVPGHSSGTLRFFPQYACPGAVNPGEFCLGNPESERFIKAIFQEVMELFPESEFIHIGGDEANSANWEKCPLCNQAMQSKHLSTMRELENDFMNRIGQFILDNHRTPILWGTCSGQIYPADMAIQCWLDIREPLRVAANGNTVIYSVHTSLYLDYPANLSEPWETWMFELSERGIYMCDPYIIWPDKVKDAVLGTEACLWTETIPQWRVMQKLLPRLYAYSEAAWSEPANKDYGNFVQRKEMLEAAGYNQKIYSL